MATRSRIGVDELFDLPDGFALARRAGAPILYVGAVEALEITSRQEVPVEDLLASAAIPEPFRGVTDAGRDVYGLGDYGRTKVRWFLHERRLRSSPPPMFDQPQPSL